MKTSKIKRLLVLIVSICILIMLAMSSLTMSSLAIDLNETPDMENLSNYSNISRTYRSDVDQDYGFYRVIDMSGVSAPYDITNHTLTIYVGDTVTWINDATPDEPLTIINKEGLWENRSAYLRWNYQKFSYTFNESGIYEMYIKEYPREQHQIVIVKDIITPVVTTTTILTTPTITVFPTTSIENGTENDTTPVGKTEKETPIEGVVAIMALVLLIIYISRKK